MSEIATAGTKQYHSLNLISAYHMYLPPLRISMEDFVHVMDRRATLKSSCLYAFVTFIYHLYDIF